MKKTLFATAMAALTLGGCASSPSYTSPSATPPRISEPLVRPKAEIMGAAQRALISAGYQVTSTDASSGTISTAPHTQPLKETEVDCGKGEVDFLQDQGTVTQVQLGVIAGNGTLTVQANITGVYKHAGSSDLTLVCVSRGSIEQDMMARINQQLPVHVP